MKPFFIYDNPWSNLGFWTPRGLLKQMMMFGDRNASANFSWGCQAFRFPKKKLWFIFIVLIFIVSFEKRLTKNIPKIKSSDSGVWNSKTFWNWREKSINCFVLMNKEKEIVWILTSHWYFPFLWFAFILHIQYFYPVF